MSGRGGRAAVFGDGLDGSGRSTVPSRVRNAALEPKRGRRRLRRRRLAVGGLGDGQGAPVGVADRAVDLADDLDAAASRGAGGPPDVEA